MGGHPAAASASHAVGRSRLILARFVPRSAMPPRVESCPDERWDQRQCQRVRLEPGSVEKSIADAPNVDDVAVVIGDVSFRLTRHAWDSNVRVRPSKRVLHPTSRVPRDDERRH